MESSQVDDGFNMLYSESGTALCFYATVTVIRLQDINRNSRHRDLLLLPILGSGATSYRLTLTSASHRAA